MTADELRLVNKAWNLVDLVRAALPHGREYRLLNEALVELSCAMRASPDRAETGTGSVSGEAANSTRSREAGGAQ